MVVDKGENIHLIMRRLFETDLRRHFIGRVVDVSGDLIRVEGYVFIFDTAKNQFIRRPDKRIRVIGLSDVRNIINILPDAADIDQAAYTYSKEGRLVVTDGSTFSLDINEFGTRQ